MITKHKKASKEVSADNNVKNDGTVRVLKSLFRGEKMNKVNSISGAIRLKLYSLTSPWGNNGVRICKITNYIKIKQEIEEMFRERQTAINELVAEYDNLLANDKVTLGSLFDPQNYPQKSQFINCFYHRITVAPLEKSDFRTNILNQEELNEINKQIEDRIEIQVKETKKEALNRVMEKLLRLKERLLLSSDEKFHNSAISNVVESTEEAKQLNISDDDELDNILNDIAAKIGIINPEAVRSGKKSTVKAYESIVDAEIQKITDVMSQFSM